MPAPTWDLHVSRKSGKTLDRRRTPCQHVHGGEGHHCIVLSPCRATMSMVHQHLTQVCPAAMARCSEGKLSQTAG